MKNILVTGGAGFVGHNFILFLLEKLQDESITVIDIDHLNKCSCRPSIQDKHYIFYKIDIKDQRSVSDILKKHNVDTVLHFAGQLHVDKSFKNSIQFTQDNVVGTNSLLECCRLYNKINLFIYFSTDEVYGDVPLDHKGCLENSPLNPTNPYAATKAAAEFLVRSFGHSYNFPYIIVRSTNIYGPFQCPVAVIPLFIHNLFDGKVCSIHGTGLQMRHFIHINDVSNGLWILLKQGKAGEIYNIGSIDQLNPFQVHEKLMKIIQPEEKAEQYIKYVEDRPYNDKRYAIDCTKLKLLGWHQTVSFDEGLKSTVNWYQENIQPRS